MRQSFMKKLKVFATSAIIASVVASCGKPDFKIATAPPDVGADSGSTLIDTTLKFDNSRIMQAAIWPGLVCSSEPRYPSVVLNLDLNYKTAGTNLRESVVPAPMFSTGYYAAPGELITIDVPAGIYSLSAQIGASTEDLSSRVNPARDPIIFVKSQLSPGRNYLRNLYGGTILINSGVPIQNSVSITLGNVVKSPDFVLGETDPDQWKVAIQNSCVPQIELRSKYVSFTVPKAYCIDYPINDIKTALAQWDSVITRDYYAWEGLSFTASDPVDQAPLLPYRVVFDIQLANPNAYGHNGNPVMATSDPYWFSGIGSLSPLNGGGNWGFLHEIGHNNQQNDYWSWSTLGETTNNLFAFKVADRMSKSGSGVWPPAHPSLATSIPSALTFATASGSKDFDGSDTRIDDPFSRLTPFVQLFDYIKPNMAGVNNSNNDGWALMGELYSQARRAVRPNITDLSKHDFVYQTLCGLTQYDWKLFFQAWGITISDVAMLNMSNLYPLTKRKVWEYNPLTRTGGNTDVASVAASKLGWTIAGYDSQNDETAYFSDGSNTKKYGLATSIFDDKLDTYWQPDYTSAPHYIIINFNQNLSFNQFLVANTTNSVQLTKFNMYISNDNVNWTLVTGSPFSIATGDVNQLYTLSNPISARYVKLAVEDNSWAQGNDGQISIAEFTVMQ